MLFRFIFSICLVVVANTVGWATDCMLCICTTPGAFSITSATPTPTSVTLIWNSSASSQGYDVYMKLSSSGVFNKVGSTGGTTSTINNLTAGESYDFKVVSNFTCVNDLGVVCGSRATNSSNFPTVVTSDPVTPGGSFNSAITQTTFTANWNASGGATGYAVEMYNGGLLIYSNTTNASTTSLSISDGDIAAGGTYSWRVKALGANGRQSAFTTGLAITMVPPNPGGLGATGQSVSSITLGWDTANGATGYRLDVADNSSFSPMLAGLNNSPVGTNSKTIGSLSAGTTYYYRVRAENGSGTSGSTQSNTITVCTVPVGSAATHVTEVAFKAKWQATTGAASYRLDVSLDDFASLLTNYNNLSVAGTEQNVSGLSAGVAYKYRVRAVNASGTSVNSAPISVVTVPGAPTVAAPDGVLQTQFNAKWNTVTGATGYRLDVSKDNFSTFVLSDEAVTVNSMVVQGLDPGTTYQYRVRATNGSGASANSDVGDVTLIPSNPISLETNTATQNSFQLQWAATAGATSYRVDVSDDDFASFVSGYNNQSVAGTSLLVTNLLAGTEYQARVRAVSAGGTSGSSTPVAVVLVPAEPTTTSADEITQATFDAKWNAATGATQYRLDVSTDNFNTFLAGFNNRVVATTKQSLADLTAGETYQYRVRAENASGISGNSPTASVILIPANPETTGPSGVALTSFTANWNEVVGASDYRLDVSNNNFSSLLPGYANLVVNGTSQPINGLAENTTYQYRVRASNSSGTSGHSNVSVAVLNPTVATALPASAIGVTTFTANWTPVANALGYRLDVSTDNFVTRVSGYDDLSVSGTSKDVTGLSSGTTYQVRVRTVNNSGVSGNSNSISVTLLPSTPGVAAVQDITASSATLNWQAVNGATSYRLDVSVDQFNSYVSGFENLPVNGLSKSVTGLSSGTTYYFRLRAENGSGVSASSTTASLLTVPGAPVLATPANVTASGFTATWSSVVGAETYRLDVATNSTFTNFVQGFQNLSLAGTSIQVDGLSAGLTYYVRVRAINATGVSENSSSLEQTTVPASPVDIVVTDRQTDRFVVTWASLPGATHYEADVATDDQFANRLSGFNPKQVTTGELSVTGLTSSTLYYVRIRSKNNSGSSGFSNTKTIATLSTGGGNEFELKMSSPVFPPVLSTSGSSITLDVTGGVGPRQATLHHRPITGTEFSDLSITYSATNKGFEVVPTWFDELGMEFYITVTDGQSTLTTDHLFMKKNVDRMTLPEAYGGELKDYRIIALPYITDAASLENLFEPTLGAYDKRKWRLVRYQNHKNVDYEDGLSKTKMERGLGYWFNSKNKVDITWASLSVPGNHQGAPFEMALQQGWNQIGNPFPFPLDWEKVKEFNQGVEVSDVLLYDSEKTSLVEAERIPIYSGGFLWADRAMTIQVPVTAKGSNSGGRRVDRKDSFGEGEWMLNILLEQTVLQNTLSGLGMRSGASEGKDIYDMPVVPRFGKFLEWRSDEKQTTIPLSRSIVGVADNHMWRFDVKSNSGEDITLRWNINEIPEGQLILEDTRDHRLIDMKQVSSYSFAAEERTINVHFDRRKHGLETKELFLGNAYPNPAIDVVHFTYAYQNEISPAGALLVVRSLTGTEVKRIQVANTGEGLQKLTWKVDEGGRPAPGLYLYELKADGREAVRGKLLIEQ